MKPQWDRITEQLADVSETLKEFIGFASEKKFVKAKKMLMDKYNKLVAQMQDFDRYVQPISPITIRMPWETPEFAEKWQYYKDFLMEQHSTYLSSRSEQIMLNQLKKWANKSQPTAMDILDFLMVNRYRKFFKPTDKQISGEELPADEQEAAPSSPDMNVNKKMRV